MYEKYFNKCIALAIIFLLIGLAFAPSINANVGKEELVEFTTEVCGMNVRKQTVKLTQQQADEVDALFNSIREKLNTTESREEAEKIFKEAIVELDKFGLLGGLSVKQAQKLVNSGNYNPRLEKALEKTSMDLRVKRNFCCLLAGNTDYTIFNSFLSNLFLLLSFLFIGLDVFVILWMTSYYFTNLFPISFGQTISLGVQGTQWTYPANGWVYSIGIIGVRQWEGDIIGNIRQGILDDLIGITGFVGIKIYDNSANDIFYIGFACRVKLSELD